MSVREAGSSVLDEEANTEPGSRLSVSVCGTQDLLLTSRDSSVVDTVLSSRASSPRQINVFPLLEGISFVYYYYLELVQNLSGQLHCFISCCFSLYFYSEIYFYIILPFIY